MRSSSSSSNRTIPPRACAKAGMLARSTVPPCMWKAMPSAPAAKATYNESLKAAGYPEITTEVSDLEPFYYAEDYHQQYLHKVPNGYCGLNGTGVACAIPYKLETVAEVQG